MPGASVAVDRRRGHHEVSILTAAGTGVGRCFGSQPLAKVSMMTMRPPQQGHGPRQHARFIGGWCLWRLGRFGGRRHGEQLARPRDVGGPVAAGQEPVVADAMAASA